MEKTKEQFLALQSREDVANILGIKEKSLRYFLYVIKTDNMYTEFTIQKKGVNKITDAVDNPLYTYENGVADSIIQSDIEGQNEFVTHNVNITKVETIKRQTNITDKEDIVYVHVEGQSEDFLVMRNYKLLYVLYNEGWLLESMESYEGNGYYDSIIALHGIDSEIVAEDFLNTYTEKNVEISSFVSSYRGTTSSNIENIAYDGMIDQYCQEIQVQYDLFTKKARIEITYTLVDYTWIPNICVADEYVLSDNITGHWVYYMKASHPLHKDSVMSVDLVKIDDMNCSCEFLWTSRIEGGYDQSFSTFGEVHAHFYENGELAYIDLGHQDVDGTVQIRPEGVVFDSALSTNKYILNKDH
ncbi:MAG: hypothetical protein ACI4HQ_14250 [Acetatifactor sp.]